MKKTIIAFSVAVALVAPMVADAARLNHETHYQEIDCALQSGKTEHVLPDRTRVDCLTPDLAIEYDFADKWYQCITQSLHYAMFTGTQASCALIIEHDDDNKYFYRADRVIKHYGLPVKLHRVYPD